MNAGKEKLLTGKTLLSILGLTFILFAKTITYKFVSLDDPAYVTNNPYIKEFSLSGIAAIFSSFYNFNYHPLTTILYAIEFKLFGLNAAGYHFISLLLHLLNVVLVFSLLLKITGRKEIAIVCSLLFGVHPMHVESVAWVSEQKDLLYTLFYLLSIGCYVNYIHNKSKKQYGFTLLFFILSLLSKPAAITLPFILFLLDLYYGKKFNKISVFEKVPFLLLSTLFAVLTFLSQHSGGALNSELMPPYSLLQRVFVVCYTFCFYIFRLVYPADLAALHYAPQSLSTFMYCSPFFIAALLFLIFKAKPYKKELVFGLLFYLFSICLTLQIIPVGYSIVSERYSYVPYIGLLFIFGNMYVAVSDGKMRYLLFMKPALRYIFLLMVLACAAVSWQRIDKWKDSESLFTDLVKKYPNAYHAQFSLGKTQAENKDTTAAIQSAVADPYFYRGNMFFGRNDFTHALADYKKATELNPGYAQAFYNMGVCYNSLQNFTEAETVLTRSLNLQPNEFTYQVRANTYFYTKQYVKAIADYSGALKLNPNMPGVYNDRGVCYLYLQDKQKACADWKTAAEMGFQRSAELLANYCK